jgi:hypothetical protein
MRYPFILLILLLLHVINLNAQITNSMPAGSQTLRGVVTDKGSRIPLPYVNLKLISGPDVIEFSADEQGRFRIHVPTGRYNLELSLIGYEQLIVNELLITSGKETTLSLEMEHRSTDLNEVVVQGSINRSPLNQMAMVSGRSFSPEETNRYAGAAFDPARMAQSFAGVIAAGDNNEIIVRGNSPKSLQWRLEGIEIINPNHFANEGSSGGSISMLNTTVLSTSDFYTGGLPAEYGNALSGAFDLKFRRGNTEKREYAFSVGILGVGATFEGPFKKGSDASYLLSYRYSSLSLLEKAGLAIASDGVPKYQDLSFNMVFPTSRAGTFSLFGIGGTGDINDIAGRDNTDWEERFDGRDAYLGYDAASVGLKHFYIAGSKLYFNNIISYSASRNTYQVDSLTTTYTPVLIDESRNNNYALRYAGSLNYSLNSSNIIRAGINTSFLSYDIFTQSYNTENQGLMELIKHKGSTSSFDGFIQYQARISSRFTLNSGIHANYFRLSDSWSIEPRFGFNWEPGAGQMLSFGAGVYSRLEPLPYYFAGDRTLPGSNSKDLATTKSAQASLSYENLLLGGVKLKTEVYYQHLYDVPVSSDPSIHFSLLDVSDNSGIYSSSYRRLVNEGTGQNYGLEVSAEKPLSKGYYFMFSSSLFDSGFKALDKRKFNTSFNTRYVGNLLAGKEWKAGRQRDNLFGLNVKLIYVGGRRYSPVLIDESVRLDEEVIDQDKINTLISDPYTRIDFSSSYRINAKRTGHLILLEIQNILNRENIMGMHYNPSKRIVEPRKWTGIIPSLNYRIEF